MQSSCNLSAISTIDIQNYYLLSTQALSPQLLSLWLWMRLLSALGIAFDDIKIFEGISPITHLKWVSLWFTWDVVAAGPRILLNDHRGAPDLVLVQTVRLKQNSALFQPYCNNAASCQFLRKLTYLSRELRASSSSTSSVSTWCRFLANLYTSVVLPILSCSLRLLSCNLVNSMSVSPSRRSPWTPALITWTQN